MIEIPQLFELIGDVKGKNILDIGCGAGGHDRKLIELGAKSILGIDISKKMLEEATGLELILYDERLTTVEVTKMMISADLSRSKRKNKVDTLAATLILQSYLDSINR